MASKGQFSLLDVFETAKPANPLFCHQDFLEKLAAHSRDSIGKRAAFLLQRLCVDSRRLHYKATQGANRGWRRSRLGGNHGSHFYAWWAPKSAAPLKESEDFAQVPDGALFLRDIRHHDDHSLLPADSPESHYLPITVRDLRREEYGPLPWTQPQMRFAASRQSVRLLKGHPGSGKTSALFHAADSSGAKEVLYVTYSRDLASLAREYFDRFCSSHKRFHVVTFPTLVRQVLGVDAPDGANQEAKLQFFRDLVPLSRALGPWANDRAALYDELFAHIAGDALPMDLGRFDACTGPRVSEKAYRKRRLRHLGEPAVRAVLEIASRLEKLNHRTITESYFPELALAWRAMQTLRSARAGKQPSSIDAMLLNIDCIAVDECQDLTPLEAFFLIELTALTNSQRRLATTLLLSGDEAQTVRPTDFEWGWLSDLLHSQIGTPSEYKLSANLRSPQRIAELVNRVWDLYAHLDKQERPSGTGHAEIEDDATDQVLYSSAKPGAELDDLFLSLSAREGLAIITLEEAVPAYVPEGARHAVLTVSEAKGLDFNSVCILDGGRHLERIIRDNNRQNSGSDIEGLRRRLTIDQLRVALSRPTERLFWIDINPTDQIVRQSIAFLNGNDVEARVASCVPSVLAKTLEEDALDLEERVQLCQSDARQYLDVKPGVAWSRAQQAVSLLGRPGSLAAVTDEAARNAAFLTLAEVCFILGSRNVQLPPELGKPDLFYESQRAAANAKRPGLALILDAIGRLHVAPKGEIRLHALVDVARTISERRAEIESWLLLEISSHSKAWMEELESAVFSGHNAVVLLKLLPPFYEALAVPDRLIRTGRLQQRAIQLLTKERQFAPALEILQGLAERQPKIEAACYEGLGDFRHAAERHIEAGNRKEALACYRSIPDLDSALKMIDEIGDHPAAESLRWMSDLRSLAAKRPDKFSRVVMPAEKKLLEEILERSLGVTRAKPAARKAAAKKSATPRKRVTKKTTPSNPYF